MRVIPIKKEDYRAWLLDIHYAERLCSVSYAFGIYEDSRLLGIVTYGSPPSESLCIGICGREYKNIVLELNRLCCENKPNIASQLIGKSLKLLPKPSIVVSYADTSMGHIGYVYQATNWLYTGLSAKRTERYDSNNPKLHSKTVTNKINVKYNQLAIRERPQKHRYIYFVGTTHQRKTLKSLLKYKIKPYPKGDSRKYDITNKIATQELLLI